MKGIEPLTYRVLAGNSAIEPHSHINPLFSFTLRAVNLTLFILEPLTTEVARFPFNISTDTSLQGLKRSSYAFIHT